MSKLIKLGKEEVLREDWESTPGSVRELVKKLVQENEELREKINKLEGRLGEIEGNCSGGHEGMRVAGSKNLELRRSEPLCLTSRGLKPY